MLISFTANLLVFLQATLDEIYEGKLYNGWLLLNKKLKRAICDVQLFGGKFRQVVLAWYCTMYDVGGQPVSLRCNTMAEFEAVAPLCCNLLMQWR